MESDSGAVYSRSCGRPASNRRDRYSWRLCRANMKSAAWFKALKTCADPRRARHFLELLSATEARLALQKASPEQTRILTALLSGSNALGTLLVAHPGWLAGLTPDALKFPRSKQGLRSEAADWLQKPLGARDYASALARVREFKQRQMLRIAARDLARLANVSEIIQEISDTADLCLARVWQICQLQLSEHFGQPYHQDADGRWHRTEGAVLGMGKLGGQELNYSSDVDVILVYSEEGSVFKEEPRMLTSGRASGKPSPLPRSVV